MEHAVSIVYDHWREDQDPAAFETAVYWLLTP
jgi:hypothetical protein